MRAAPNWQLHDGDVIQSMDGKAAAKMGALALNASISKAASVPLHLVVERSGKKLPLTMQGENATASGTPVAGVGSRDHSEERAPDFTLAGTGGKAVHVASVNKQSWVLLNFWGSWCSGCLLECLT